MVLNSTCLSAEQHFGTSEANGAQRADPIGKHEHCASRELSTAGLVPPRPTLVRADDCEEVADSSAALDSVNVISTEAKYDLATA
jgi:hypothetical protein